MHVRIGGATDPVDPGFQGKRMAAREGPYQHASTFRYGYWQVLHQRRAHQDAVPGNESDQRGVVVVSRVIPTQLQLQSFARVQLRGFKTTIGNFGLVEVGHLGRRTVRPECFGGMQSIAKSDRLLLAPSHCYNEHIEKHSCRPFWLH